MREKSDQKNLLRRVERHEKQPTRGVSSAAGGDGGTGVRAPGAGPGTTATRPGGPAAGHRCAGMLTIV